MELTLKNGQVLSGSYAEMCAFLKNYDTDTPVITDHRDRKDINSFSLTKGIGVPGRYFSNSRGAWIPIVEMETKHICNALRKGFHYSGLTLDEHEELVSELEHRLHNALGE